MTEAKNSAAQRGQQANLEAALSLADRGWRIFPARPDKRPAIKWRDGASTDPAAISRWWRRWPDALPALPCGPAGLVVIDLDVAADRDGIAEFARLVRQNGPVPATMRVRTPRNGVHIYFRAPNEHVRSTASVVAPAIDVRGHGGFVIAPGSTLRDGRQYRLLPGVIDPAPLPEWLLRLIAPPPLVRQPIDLSNIVAPTRYLASALRGEAQAVADTAQGRNNALNRSAFRLGQLVSAGLPPDVIRAALTKAARAAGLDDREIDATIASGLTAGQRSSRGRAS